MTVRRQFCVSVDAAACFSRVKNRLAGDSRLKKHFRRPARVSVLFPYVGNFPQGIVLVLSTRGPRDGGGSVVTF